MYTTIQCLQKHYRPVGEIIEEIQSRIDISCCPMFITTISITIANINERFPCTERSAQKNFHVATSSRLATNVKRKKDKMKILQPIENDRS